MNIVMLQSLIVFIWPRNSCLFVYFDVYLDELPIAISERCDLPAPFPLSTRALRNFHGRSLAAVFDDGG